MRFHSPADPGEQRRITIGVLLSLLFLLALWLRLTELHTPFFGDQSIYYYLSYTLGVPPASARDLEPLVSHVVVRPFMYLFFFPWAHLGLTAFRLVNIVVGSTIPCWVLLICTRSRVSPYVALPFAVITCLHRGLIEYSARVFPDTLALALVLLGCLFYLSRRMGLAGAALTLAALTKEAYAVFLLPLTLDGALAYWRTRSWRFLAPLAGFTAAVSTNAFSVFVLHARPQGWSQNALYDGFFSGFLWTYWFIPVGLLLIAGTQWLLLALSLTGPLFYIGWAVLLKRGVEGWYIIGPLCFALIATAVAFQTAITAFFDPTPPGATRTSSFNRSMTFIRGACGAGLLAIVLMQPASSGWRDIAKFESIGDAAKAHLSLSPVRSLPVVERLMELRPSSVYALDTFWGYSFYPLSFVTSYVEKFYTSANASIASDQQIIDTIARHEAVVWGPVHTAQAKRIYARIQACQVYSDEMHRLIANPRRCLAAPGTLSSP